MPTYEYYCECCGEVSEEFATISKRRERIECPVCHSAAERIFLTAPGLPYRDPEETGGYYVSRKNYANVNWKRFAEDGEYNCKVCEQVIGKSRDDIGNLGDPHKGNPNAKANEKRIQVSGYNPRKAEGTHKGSIVISRC